MINENPRSPFGNLLNIISGLPHANEKPMKHAFFNAIALFLLSLCCVAGYALFLILEPFFKPLFWALLVGSILHPFKYSLSKSMKKWFDNLEKNNTSIVVGITAIPFNAINYVSDSVGYNLKKHFKLIGIFLISLFVLPWIYFWLPRSCVCLVLQFGRLMNSTMTMLIYICNSYIVFTLLVAYLISVYKFWNPENEPTFRKVSILVWLCISFYISSLTGPLQVVTFIVLQVLAVIGFVIEVYDLHRRMKENDNHITMMKCLYYTFLNKNPEKYNKSMRSNCASDTSNLTEAIISPGTPDQKPDDESLEDISDSFKRTTSCSSERVNRAKTAFKTRTLSALPLTTHQTSSSFEAQILASLQKKAINDTFGKQNLESGKGEEEETALYFKLLLWACGGMVMWKHIWIWPLLLIFIAVSTVKNIGFIFGVWDFMWTQYNNLMLCITKWCEDRYSAFIPAHVRGIHKLVQLANSSVSRAAHDSIDTVASCVVIVGVILFLSCASIFIIVQIYSEAVVVIQLSGSVLNSTVVRNPELRGLLPDGWDDKLDSLLDNAYTYGREGISKLVKGVLKDADEEKSARLEQQVLELWDRICQSWMAGDAGGVGPNVDTSAIQHTWDSFVTDITKSPGVFNYNGAIEWLQANVGTLTAIAGGLWAPLASNVSLLLGSLTAFTSVLLGGGTAILNFILSLVVFLTTLFYLLASSDALYKPIEVITQTAPNIGPRFGIALSVAINQVFRASFKMATFYGLWTWLVHNLFGAKVVYLPSALAAVMGAAPFLSAWLACLPAALDVWLAQGRPIAAVLLVLAQAAPTSVVDAAIYKEIRNGGHPYLTGLAIAGGIFCLGTEGAILGPLLLCCLLVVLNLSSSVFRDSPAEDHHRSTHLRFNTFI